MSRCQKCRKTYKDYSRAEIVEKVQAIIKGIFSSQDVKLKLNKYPSKVVDHFISLEYQSIPRRQFILSYCESCNLAKYSSADVVIKIIDNIKMYENKKSRNRSAITKVSSPDKTRTNGNNLTSVKNFGYEEDVNYCPSCGVKLIDSLLYLNADVAK